VLRAPSDVGGVKESGLDILRRNVVSRRDHVGRLIGGKIVENDGDHHAGAADAGSAVADGGVNGDAILPSHDEIICGCGMERNRAI